MRKANFMTFRREEIQRL